MIASKNNIIYKQLLSVWCFILNTIQLKNECSGRWMSFHSKPSYTVTVSLYTATVSLYTATLSFDTFFFEFSWIPFLWIPISMSIQHLLTLDLDRKDGGIIAIAIYFSQNLHDIWYSTVFL